MASRSNEPLSVDQRDRNYDLPVGLKNVGNSCYSNALIQSIVFLPNVLCKIMNARVDRPSPHLKPTAENEKEVHREAASRNMIM